MRLISCLTALVALAATAAVAAVPPTMNYQGILTDAAGAPVADGAYSVTFSIHNAATSGAARWTETQTLVTTNGLFTTVLGAVTPIPDTAVTDTAAYLQIIVESDPPLGPRTRLTSGAFAMVSSAVLGAGPILLEYEDVASGAQSVYSFDVKPGGSGPAGKNIGKNISVTLPSANESVEMEEIIGISDASKSAVAIPAFMKNSRKAKASESASTREILDTDSGYAKIVTFMNSTDTLESIELINPPAGSTKSAVAIPAFMKNARKAKTAEAASSREILDTDSGYAMVVSLAIPNESLEMHDILNMPGTTAAVAVPSLIQNSRKAKLSDTVDFRLILDTDSGFVETVKTKKPNFISVMQSSATQTREHVLLARQVGVSGGGTSYPSLQLQTTSVGSKANWIFADSDNDSSEVEVSVDDTEQKITLSTSTSAAKWPNIVLKRGVTATEMTLSYVDAGTTSVLHASVDGAGGARLGINTSTPTLAFQLVGSGCYTGTFGACSDRRYKDDITTLANPIEMVKRLRGVSFEWKRSEFADHNFPAGEQIGVIAQEIEEVVPGIVTDDLNGYKSVDYAKLVPILIEAVKEQQRTIEAQNARLANLERKLDQKPVHERVDAN